MHWRDACRSLQQLIETHIIPTKRYKCTYAAWETSTNDANCVSATRRCSSFSRLRFPEYVTIWCALIGKEAVDEFEIDVIRFNQPKSSTSGQPMLKQSESLWIIHQMRIWDSHCKQPISNCDMLSSNPDNDIVKMRIAMAMVSKSRLPGRRLKVACSQCGM